MGASESGQTHRERWVLGSDKHFHELAKKDSQPQATLATSRHNVQGQSHSNMSTRLQNHVFFLRVCGCVASRQAQRTRVRQVHEQTLRRLNRRMVHTGSSIITLAVRVFLGVAMVERARHTPAAWRGVSLPGAPWIPSGMFASASALRSARDTGFVSMPCPSAVGASRPIERSAFIVAIVRALCVDARVSVAGCTVMNVMTQQVRKVCVRKLQLLK
jgi:hypothetical protein